MKKLIIIVVTGVLLSHYTNATSGICQRQQQQQLSNAEDEEDAVIIYAQFGHLTKMTCCVPDSKFDTVTWYKLDAQTQQWSLVNSSDNTLILEDGQVLIIESVYFDDGGEYKCDVISNSLATEKQVERTFNLSIVTCDLLARGPFAISPLPCEKTVAKTYDNLVLPCTGYFGCEGGADVRQVTWFVAEKDVEQWEEVSVADPRYSVESYNNHNGVMGNFFHISRVLEEDYNRRFMCVLFSTQSIHGQTNLQTSLIKQTEDGTFVESASFSIIVAFSSLVVIIFVITTSVTVCMSRRLSAKNSKLRQSWTAHRQTDIVKSKNRDIDEVDPCLKPSDLNYV